MRSVGPKFLKPVELAVFRKENVGDNVAVVQYDPEIVLESLCAERLSALPAHLFDDIVRNRVDSGGGVSVADHKMVGDCGPQWPEVYVDDVLSFLVEHSVGHNPQIVCNHIQNVLYFCISNQMYKYTINSESMKEEVNIQWMEEVDSTNSEVRRRIAGLGNLSVIAAVHQTSGRGQRGNLWLSSVGKNLTFTMLVKFGDDGLPPLKANRQFALSRCVALGVADYLGAEGIKCLVKWPNDIYAGNRKICGILIENILQSNFLAASVIGIGLNVNQKDFPPQLVNPVSMSNLTGKEYDLKEQLPALCGYIRDRLRSYDNENEYVSRLYRLGVFNEYVICSTGESVTARIVGVTESGKLCIITSDEERKEFAFKEINYLI